MVSGLAFRTFRHWFANLATLKQIHSSTCIPAAGRSGMLGEGDALLENTPGAVVAVKTADCIPVLLVDERQRAVAAVHAGWRGTAARIVPEARGRDGELFRHAARRICTPPSGRASASAAMRWVPK